MLGVGLQVAQQDDVVFVAARVANGPIDVGQQVHLRRHAVGIDLDVDQREGERLALRRAADAETTRSSGFWRNRFCGSSID